VHGQVAELLIDNEAEHEAGDADDHATRRRL